VEALEINEQTVIVRSGITPVNDPGTEDSPGFTGWLIAKEEVYEKDEYIRLMDEKNTTLEATVDSILTEVIPAMLEM
jgi:hypothetical protein